MQLECNQTNFILQEVKKTKIYNFADTENVPINITGFRPSRSATTPHKTDVKALPTINEDPR